MEYNQNDVAKFVPLDQHKGRDVIMVAKGQEQGVVLCDLGNEFVTWKIYRHDGWLNTNHGNYVTYGSVGDKAEAFEQAKADFFDRVEGI